MQKLYNEEQKQGFLDSLPNYKNERTKKNYENLLISISEYERIFNKDFSNMNVNEVKVIISSMGNVATSSLNTVITILRDYSDWCISNGKTNFENALNKITANDFDVSFNIRCKLLKDPENLHLILLNAFGNDLTDLNGYAFQSQLVAWLLYFGFTKDEILNLKKQDSKDEISLAKYKKDFDFKDKNDLIFNLLDLCSKLDIVFNPSVVGTIVKETLVDSAYVLRGKQNVRAKDKMASLLLGKRVTDINSKFSENTGQLIELTPDRIYLSGLYHKIHLMEQSGFEITSKLIYDIFKMKYKNKNTIANETSKRLKDYKNWKVAFVL